MRPGLVAFLVVCSLSVAACGNKDVDAASYTCGQFNKSLRTKDDNTAGNYINQLRKKVDLGKDTKTENALAAQAVYFACVGQPASKRPLADATTNLKKMKAGTFTPPKGSKGKKKSTK